MTQTAKPAKPAKAKPPKPKPKESKPDTFLRIAKPRVEKVLKALRILGNCSNRSIYEYNEEQISQMFTSLHEAINLTENKFSKSKAEQEKFDFN